MQRHPNLAGVREHDEHCAWHQKKHGNRNQGQRNRRRITALRWFPTPTITVFISATASTGRRSDSSPSSATSNVDDDTIGVEIVARLLLYRTVPGAGEDSQPTIAIILRTPEHCSILNTRGSNAVLPSACLPRHRDIRLRGTEFGGSS